MLSPRSLMNVDTKAPCKNADKLNLEAFVQQRKPETKMKRLPPDWEKISANDVTNKGFISRIHKQLP